jgi:hypothetical protein
MQKVIEMKTERRTQHNTSGKLFNRAHCGAEALVEIQNFDFFIHFLYFYLILYHSNSNQTKFELNWMEGVA